ncbi:MAG: hypothetical protein V4486_00175 [Patescibacteria group bacterium]
MVFLIVIFSIKGRSVFNNNSSDTGLSDGLKYDSSIVENLVSKDSDKDGVPDWEEGLWGTNPNNKDSNGDGVTDDKEIAKLKAELKQNTDGLVEDPNSTGASLTQTDKFSQELLTTLAAINQTGDMDPATAQKLGETLATQIENSAPKKVYGAGDIKITKDDSAAAIQKYNEALDSITRKYPASGSAMDVLQKFAADQNNEDTTVLSELDPIVTQTNQIIAGIVKTSVPQSLASLHLAFINSLEKVSENLNDIQLYNTDAVVALAAISQYEQNTADLQAAVDNLSSTINQKLSS